MRRIFETAGATVLLILFTFAVACGGDSDSNGYPKGVRDNFLTSCTGSGGSQSQCRCILDGFEKKYTLEQFIALEQRATTGPAAAASLPELQAIILECIGD